MKVLIIEDNRVTRKQLRSILSEFEFDIFESESGERGLEICENNDIDLIILDINLVSMTGYSVCRLIRQNNDKYGNPRILMLSERSETEELLMGFRKGTDDYLRKPFVEEELVFRVMSLFKREGVNLNKKLSYKNLKLDVETKELYVDDEIVKITIKEFGVIELLVKNKGTLVKKEKFYNEIWNRNYYPEMKTLDVCLSRIRKKVPSLAEYIKSYRGLGYRLD